MGGRMRWNTHALEGYEVIGHIPKNRALYALPVDALPPSPFKRKGRKRVANYGCYRNGWPNALEYPTRSGGL